MCGVHHNELPAALEDIMVSKLIQTVVFFETKLKTFYYVQVEVTLTSILLNMGNKLMRNVQLGGYTDAVSRKGNCCW